MPLFSNLLYLLIKETFATDLPKSHTKVSETSYIFPSSVIYYNSCQKVFKISVPIRFCTDLSHVTAKQDTHPAFLWLQLKGRK